MQTGAIGETFVSKPLIFEGQHLYLNAEASRGAIEVELVPAPLGDRIDPWTPETCSGLSFDDAVSVNNDGVEQKVFWNKGPSVAHLQGKPVRFRIRVRNADLYGFRLDA